jgi:pyruvate/2-oxoglutarate/acetoin dehydrogenase E1 component
MSYVSVPGLMVLMPSGPRTAYGLLKAAIRGEEPVIFFEPKSIYRAFREEIPVDGEPYPLGKAETLVHGNDVTVVTWGAMVRKCREAAERVASSTGAGVEVIDLLTLKPMDPVAVMESVKRTGRCVVVHEAPRTGGFAGEIFARINEREDVFYSLRAPLARVAAYDVPYPLFARENAYLPDTDRIEAQILKTLGA